MAEEEGLEHREKVGKLEADVHTLTKSVEKIFTKLDELISANTPQQISIASMLGMFVSILGVFALLFGSVIYISNSSNAPLVAQSSQMITTMQAMQRGMQQNTNLIQLTSKDVSGLNNKVVSNDETLRWLLFEENLPKQLTELQVRLNHAEAIISTLGHKHGIPETP